MFQLGHGKTHKHNTHLPHRCAADGVPARNAHWRLDLGRPRATRRLRFTHWSTAVRIPEVEFGSTIIKGLHSFAMLHTTIARVCIDTYLGTSECVSKINWERLGLGKRNNNSNAWRTYLYVFGVDAVNGNRTIFVWLIH